MTIDQIKAELRRSACEDAEPVFQVHSQAFRCAAGWFSSGGWILFNHSNDDMRTFFLLVAEAIE